jgi:DivIVA domain-containing protein
VELTPRDIQDKQFHDAFRGYSHEEVDAFLDEVAMAFEKMYRDYASLEQRVAELEERPANSRVAEEMLRKTIYSAQRTATEAVEEAQSAAGKLLVEAEAKARDLAAVAEATARDAIAAAEAHAREAVAAAEERAGDIVARARATERQLDVRIAALRRFEHEYRGRLASLLEEQLRLLADTTTVAPPDVAPVPSAPQEPQAEAAPEPQDDVPAGQDDAPAVQDDPAPLRDERRRQPSAHLERAEAEPRSRPGQDTVMLTWPEDARVPGFGSPPGPSGDSGDSAGSVPESGVLRVVGGPARVRSAPVPPASRPEPAGPPSGPTRRQETRPSARGDGLDDEEHQSITRLFWGGDE